MIYNTLNAIYSNFQVNLMDDHLLFIANLERERKSISDGQVLVPSGKSLFPRRLEAKPINEAQRFLTNLNSTREYLENNPLASLISSVHINVDQSRLFKDRYGVFFSLNSFKRKTRMLAISGSLVNNNQRCNLCKTLY